MKLIKEKILTLFLILIFSCSSENMVSIKFTDRGDINISYKDIDFVVESKPSLKNVVFEKITRNENKERVYNFEKNEESPKSIEWKEKKLTYIYQWGDLSFLYNQKGNNIDIVIKILNKSDKTIANFDIGILKFSLPEKYEIKSPFDFWWGLGYKVVNKKGNNLYELNTLESPGVIEIKFGKEDFTDKFILSYSSIYPPLKYGLRKIQNHWEFYTKGGVLASEKNGVFIPPLGLPRIYSGQELEFVFSIRFADINSDTDIIVSDIYQKFRDYWKPHIEWDDRRPIGSIFVASGWEGHKSQTNPRGYFSDKTIDVFSSEGKERFKKIALDYAKRCVNVLKSINAQGMIVWNIEGEENPHPISYIGDPRMLKVLAPEMDEIADEFFKIFRDAGLRTGVCIRPTQVYFDEKDKKWKHGTGSHGPMRNPLNDDFSKIWPEDLPWWQFFPIVERLSKKIEYAKKRWGCTLFYMDTNGIHAPVGEKLDKFEWILLWTEVLREIRTRHPDVLIIPEFPKGPASWSQISPYGELKGGLVSTPFQIRKLFPQSFSVINVANGSIEKRRDEIVKAVKEGDILLTHGWWMPKFTEEVGKIYKEVYKEGAINPWE
ncbi:MAG: hypothetical protein NC827_03605 [Candidatus Omnitrophica bacterium]|nr:hypothetical protein [Candidatus Omnitrophota bacterium]MCM8802380.1 hypothetical protein [Candidatus Omnitrophota bacterium]